MEFLQQYWWCVVSLLGALLVFQLYVQGGQSLIYRVAKTDGERALLLNALGHKWELTFTTLVTFGGAMFASFPLYYATSFGGAYWLWMTLLFFFVIQAVSYEYRSKPANLLGQKNYDRFLFLNGLCGTVLLGVAVGMFFTGGNFLMEKANITRLAQPVISHWANNWNGLDALANPFNLLLGLVLFLLARVMGLLFVLMQIADEVMVQRAKKLLLPHAAAFVLLFVALLVYLFLLPGYTVDAATEVLRYTPHKYFLNMLQVPVLGVMLLLGVLLVLWGLGQALFKQGRKSFWFTGGGVVLAVWSLLLAAGLNNTAYFVSTVDPRYSLTLSNSSSSYFTLKVMAFVSILVPFVLAYISYVWRAMGKKKMSAGELQEKDSHVY